MKLFLPLISLILAYGSFAHAYEIVYVCFSTNHHENFFVQAASAAEGLESVRLQCEQSPTANAACIPPRCKRIVQPTSVSELPASTQRRIEREARASYAAPQRTVKRSRARTSSRSSAKSQAAEDARRNSYIETHAGNINGGNTRTDDTGTTHYSDGTTSRRNGAGAIDFSDGTTVYPGQIRTDSLGDVHYGNRVCHLDGAGNTTCRKE